MGLSKKSIEKLRSVKAAILANRKLYNQNDPPRYALKNGGCGAPCCFAGWAIWLDNPDPEAYETRLRFADELRLMGEVLGINQKQADALFYRCSYRSGNTMKPILNAKDGARRIEEFIHSERKER